MISDLLIRCGLGSLVTEDARARADYFAADHAAAKLWKTFTRSHMPAERADILLEIADLGQRMAEVHLIGFGPDPIEEEDDRDLADSIALSGRLLEIMSNTEYSVARGRGRYGEVTVDELSLAPRSRHSPDDHRARGVLDALSITPVAADRGRLTLVFYDEVVDQVGGQAAEVLAAIAAAYFLLAGHSRKDAYALVWQTSENTGNGAQEER
ncbi:hypothetical protein [Actinokineospora enzanensis]|uniref:hypothetical protein n=1 Tax=Actinokineospora enzanensis TaxID=155975 RepID=UPI0003712708|nr:hypothetical protein [Actinokineospora enzanensis]